MTWKSCVGFFIISLLALSLVFVQTGHAAGSKGPVNAEISGTLAAFNSSDRTDGNMTVPSEYQGGPAPITVFRVEITETSLPGPREMGYGPRSISMSVDPQILTVLIVGIIAVLAVAGYFLYTGRHRKT